MNRHPLTGIKLEKHLLHLVGKAIHDYGLIREGDRVAVALSGGKDSFSLLKLLEILRRRAPVRYEVAALTVHNGSDLFRTQRIERRLEREGVPFHLVPTQIIRVTEEKARPGTPFCSLCSRLRRGALYGAAIRLGFNRLALGHHLDDGAETLLMNLFFAGSLKAMPPKLLAENGRITVIRPLIHTAESLLRDYAREQDFPLMGCGCRLCDGPESERARMKGLVSEVSRRYGDARHSVRKALSNLQPRYLSDPNFHDFELEDAD